MAVLLCGSLLTAAAPAPADNFDATIAQAKAVMFVNPGDALRQAARAEQLAARQPVGRDRTLKLAIAEWLQGEAALRDNALGIAKPLIDRAVARLDWVGPPTKLKGDVMMSRGGIHIAKAEVAGALEDYQRAHNIFRDSGETRSQAIALLMIAGIYQEASDFTAALKYQQQALDVYGGDPMLSISIYNNRGGILSDLHRYPEAREQFANALKLARTMDSSPLQAQILSNITRVEINSGNLSAAEGTLNHALALARSGKAISWLPQLNAFAADLALKRGDRTKARSLIESTFVGIALDRTDMSFREAHYTAYDIYRTLGDAEHALPHLQAMKRLDDQLAKLSASTNTALMAARFNSANQDARISKLKADDLARKVALEQARVRFQRILFGAIAAAALIVLGLLAVGLFQSRRARVRLSRSNVALQKALAAKTEFLATTSHEIRTPLNGILGMTQVMLADPRLDPTLKDRVGIVQDAGLTMRGLVDDILDVAKMETGNLTIDALPFDLQTMLADVTRMWGEQAHAKGLDFRLELANCPHGVVGDAGRLRQVVYNLLSNAVKFTAVGGITVRVDCHGDRLRIAVIDTGIGIAADKQTEIFESFKQADGGTTRQFGGTGLGLAIVRNIATAMAGSVTVDSAPDHGAIFTVDLPYIAAEIAKVAPTTTGGLLIVDKNPIARAMLRAVLEARAGSITFASSCAEAIELLASGGIVRILVDEATARAGDADPLAQIAALVDATIAPVAVLWAGPDAAVRTALAESGVTQIIAKPIAGPALAAALYTDQVQDPLVTQAA